MIGDHTSLLEYQLHQLFLKYYVDDVTGERISDDDPVWAEYKLVPCYLWFGSNAIDPAFTGRPVGTPYGTDRCHIGYSHSPLISRIVHIKRLFVAGSRSFRIEQAAYESLLASPDRGRLLKVATRLVNCSWMPLARRGLRQRMISHKGGRLLSSFGPAMAEVLEVVDPEDVFCFYSPRGGGVGGADEEQCTKLVDYRDELVGVHDLINNCLTESQREELRRMIFRMCEATSPLVNFR